MEPFQISTEKNGLSVARPDLGSHSMFENAKLAAAAVAAKEGCVAVVYGLREGGPNLTKQPVIFWRSDKPDE